MSETWLNDFYGRDFIITSDVLIPRPETEQIIDQVLTLAGKPFLPGVKAPRSVLPASPVILDVGTGSGCIAITLALEIPESKVYAVDISKKALKVAAKNAAKHDAPITLIISHLLEKVKDNTLPTPDVVVANLPYVDKDWDWLDLETLSREPSIALFAEDHGLALIKELIDEVTSLKIPNLILEADPCQHNDIIDYVKKNQYSIRKISGYILNFKNNFSDRKLGRAPLSVSEKYF